MYVIIIGSSISIVYRLLFAPLLCTCVVSVHLPPHVQYGQTPFLTAAAKGHVEVAGFLLDNGSSILERMDVSDHQLFGTSYK